LLDHRFSFKVIDPLRINSFTIILYIINIVKYYHLGNIKQMDSI